MLNINLIIKMEDTDDDDDDDDGHHDQKWQVG